MKKLVLASILILTATTAFAQNNSEVRFVKKFMASVQTKSLKSGSIMCGYFGFDSKGKFIGTAPVRGTAMECNPNGSQTGLKIVASYHTHGRYGRTRDSEVPTIDDIFDSSIDEVNSYISTQEGVCGLWMLVIWTHVKYVGSDV